MLGVLRSVAPQHQPLTDTPRVKFKTVLGLGAAHRDPATTPAPNTPAADSKLHHSFSRRSVDVRSSHSLKRIHRRGRSSVVNTSFFEPAAPAQLEPRSTPKEMKNSAAPQSMPTRRLPRRVDNQDGPWTISVAETPHDACSYSLYIKSEFFIRRVLVTRRARLLRFLSAGS